MTLDPDWGVLSRELEAPLDGDLISQREAFGGKKLDYIESHAAIQTANEIFGHGGWSFAVRSLERVWEGDAGGKSKVSYTAVVCVKVGSVIKEDVGYGDGFGKNYGEATELAAKEAVSDAMKRCLRMFGDPFGLVLYEKNPAQKEGRIKTRMSSAKAKEEGKHTELLDMMNACASVADLHECWQDEIIPRLRWLPRKWFVPMRDHYEKTLEAIEAKEG